MLYGSSEFPTYHIFLQFSFWENMLYVLRDSAPAFPEKLCHLLLSKPNGLMLHHHTDRDFFIGCSEEDDVGLLSRIGHMCLFADY